MKKLQRSNKNKIIAGVCGGIAEYFNIDPVIVRLIFVVLVLFGFGTGILVYLIAAIIMPTSNSVSNYDDIENMKRAESPDSEGSGRNTKEGQPHSDKDFDSYFKK